MTLHWRFAASLVLALCAGAMVWTVAFADKATTQNLGGPERYLTALSTDKPMYKPGEKVYVRGVLLNAANHKPLPDGQQSQATIEIKGPKGDTVSSGDTQTQDSVFGFAWDVPKEQAGGEYTVKVTYPWTGHAPAERKFDVRVYRAPRLKNQITFLRDGYGPGETVQATLHTERAEGGVPENAKVSVIARIDGVEVRGAETRVDAKGNCSASFALPKEIARGDGTLALVIEDGGVVETASKSIPILLQTVDIKFYPEGGDLIAGFPNRVYFEAKQPNGKPADLEGEIVELPVNAERTLLKTVGAFKSEHEGRGRGEFMAQAGMKYAFKVMRPSSIKDVIWLSEVKASGSVLRASKEVTPKNEPVQLMVYTKDPKNQRITVSKRELDVAESTAQDWMSHGEGAYNLKIDVKDADGVLRVTLWDDKGVPVAERLIYKEPAKKLNVSITPEKSTYVPGDTVKLNVKTTDADGKPVSSVVSVTATDDAILEMIEKREQAPRLPVMVLLEPEVQELADAHIYLDAKNPKSTPAVDLLLGTQGWRRFAFLDSEKFIAENGDKARRAMALRIQSRVEQLKLAELRDGAAFGGEAKGLALAGAPRGANPPKPQAAAAPPPAEAVPVNAPPAVAPPVEEAAKKPVDRQNAAKDEKKEMAADARAKRVAAPEAEQQLQRALEKADADMDKNAVFARRAARKQLAEHNFVIVREFAHQVRANRQPTDRVDFAETLYWNAGVKTNAEGVATISFGLNDSVTTFRVFADVFSADGAVASASTGIESVQPFFIEPKFPLEVTAGDTILLPLNVINSIGSDLGGAKIEVGTKGEFKLATLAPFDLKAMERARQIFKIDVGFNNGVEDFTFTAKAGPYVDSVTRKLSSKPKGFPIEVPFGGMIGPDKPAVHTITIPDAVVMRSMTTNVAVYPTPLANMTEALQRLIQDPNGCFEQTSSTSYPLTMAQQYFLNHTGVDPKLVNMAREKLDAGYKRLVGFWCPDRGYEWFGQNPGHEALTAFGVLHFTDMAQVREVDKSMVENTRAWLLKQRDGKGGFERKRRALHTWIEDKDCSNAYILWALLESGEKVDGLKAEIDSLKTAASASQNSYVLALASNVFALAGDKAEATKMMEKLAAKQNKDGKVEGGTASIVGSGGETLEIETTSLATLGWLREPNFAGNVEKSMKYLADSCKSGRYGSTQSTVLALRAIVTYDKARARPKAPGKVRVFVDGQSIGGPASFDTTTQGAIKLPDLSELLTKGEHKIELKMEGGGEMPYALAINYNAVTPASAKECKLDIDVKLGNDTVVEGGITEANVLVTNKTKDVLPNPVAIIGLPGGLEPRHDQLKELVKKGTIDAYEVLGREVVLYWRGMAADGKVEVPLSLIAAVPGTYTGPASRTYLYYTDEFKQWVPGVKVSITPK
jgi:uncharacterized protein YfaS (alpha-2-macroglobulin family)